MPVLYGNKNFLLVITGKLVSLMGNSIYYVALTWYVLSCFGENSGKMLSWVIIMELLPTAIMGSIIGAIADRYNKKIIIIVSDIISGIVVFGLTALMKIGLLNAWHLLVSTALLSITTSTVRITVNSMIPEILSSDQLHGASSSTLFIDRVTQLIGLAFGGVLVGILGVQMVFLVNAFSFIISGLLEMLIKYKSKVQKELGKEDRSFIKDIAKVTHYIRQNRQFARLTLIFTFVNFLWEPLLNIVIPYVMKNDFNVTPVQFGVLQSALPVGFCIGAVIFTRYKGFIEGERVVFNSIIGINGGLTLFAIPIIFTSKFIHADWVVYYFMLTRVLSGIFSAALNISLSLTIHRIIPEDLRGKIWGIITSVVIVLIPLGGCITGMLLGKIPSSVFFIVSILGVYLLMLVQSKSSLVVMKGDSREVIVGE